MSFINQENLRKNFFKGILFVYKLKLKSISIFFRIPFCNKLMALILRHLVINFLSLLLL